MPSSGGAFLPNADYDVTGVWRFAHPPIVAGPGMGDGLTDDTATIQAALTKSSVVQLSAGTYRITAPLTVPVYGTLRGQGEATILAPAAGVVAGVILLAASTLADLAVDGVQTNGATGVSIGATAVVGNIFLRHVSVTRFTGAGARGLFLGQGVTISATDSYFGANDTNLVTDGGNTPTNSIFLNCQFRVAVTKGVRIVTGYSVLFQSCLFESNSEEGIYFANTLATATDIRLWACWFENNWNSLALGPTRHVQYECVVDGVGSGTIRPELRSCFFNGGASTARSIRFTTAIDYLLDHVKVFNEAANIRLDTNSYGLVVNWPGQNGAIGTTVALASGAVMN